MSEALLIWQAVIFTSIALSRRWRWWVVAFWCIWTLVQISGFPLSVLQFATIAISAALFQKRIPIQPETEPLVVQSDVVRLGPSGEKSGHAQSASSLLAELAQCSRDMERKSLKLSREITVRAEAGRHIKTSGFTCEIEERVMKDALAQDKALTRDIQEALAGDPLLDELYRKSLAELTPKHQERDGEDWIVLRQDREKSALMLASHHLERFNDLKNKGQDYRRLYFEAQEALFLHENKRAPSEQEKTDMQSVFGRHIEDWIVELQKSRPAQRTAK